MPDEIRDSAPAADSPDAASSDRGAVVVALAPTSARVGHDILTQGGNAIDAAVAAALCAAVVEPSSCGIAGYGAHFTIALADGTVTSIDANSAARLAARPDMFSANASGQVDGKTNYYGWLAAGVPGTLAGLQMALDGYTSTQPDSAARRCFRFGLPKRRRL